MKLRECQDDPARWAEIPLVHLVEMRHFLGVMMLQVVIRPVESHTDDLIKSLLVRQSAKIEFPAMGLEPLVLRKKPRLRIRLKIWSNFIQQEFGRLYERLGELFFARLFLRPSVKYYLT